MQEKNAQLAVGEVESLLDFLNRNLEKATNQELLSLQKQMSDQADRASRLYTNPTVKFPVPRLPQLEVHSSAKVMQVIQDDISVSDKGMCKIYHFLDARGFISSYEYLILSPVLFQSQLFDSVVKNRR